MNENSNINTNNSPRPRNNNQNRNRNHNNKWQNNPNRPNNSNRPYNKERNAHLKAESRQNMNQVNKTDQSIKTDPAKGSDSNAHREASNRMNPNNPAYIGKDGGAKKQTKPQGKSQKRTPKNKNRRKPTNQQQKFNKSNREPVSQDTYSGTNRGTSNRFKAPIVEKLGPEYDASAYHDEKGPAHLRVCTLSGTDSIGKNSNFIELNNEILIIDMGFGFPGNELYGIDYLIPNYNYLKKNKHRIKGILITHGHLDHTGALPWVLPELDFPPVYAGRFAAALITERLKEFELDKKVKITPVHRNTEVQLGQFKVSFIGVTHSIPNSFGIFVESPKGNVFFSGDYKIDTDPANEPETDYAALEALRGRVDLALVESTNAEREGKAKSSREIADNIETLVNQHTGRIVIVAFSSIISRIHSIVEAAQKANRKVVISGRSLHNSVRIAQELRYIEVPENVIISEKEMGKYPDNQILFLCTGSQGEQFGALNRISVGSHKYFKIKKGDKVLMAASEIPTNITEISNMTDRLIRLGADLVQNDSWKIHESGHGMKEDMKIMFDLIQPKNVMPIHGELTKRYKNKANYVSWGMHPDNVLLTDDGHTWLYTGGVWKQGKEVESKPILIDGLGVGDIGDIVLKDRQQLAEYGMVTVVLNLSAKGKKMIGRPRFISRGFVYVKSSQVLFAEFENVVADVHREWQKAGASKNRFDHNDLISEIESKLKKLILKKTEREPMILVVTL